MRGANKKPPPPKACADGDGGCLRILEFLQSDLRLDAPGQVGGNVAVVGGNEVLCRLAQGRHTGRKGLCDGDLLGFLVTNLPSSFSSST